MPCLALPCLAGWRHGCWKEDAQEEPSRVPHLHARSYIRWYCTYIDHIIILISFILCICICICARIILCIRVLLYVYVYYYIFIWRDIHSSWQLSWQQFWQQLLIACVYTNNYSWVHYSLRFIGAGGNISQEDLRIRWGKILRYLLLWLSDSLLCDLLPLSLSLSLCLCLLLIHVQTHTSCQNKDAFSFASSHKHIKSVFFSLIHFYSNTLPPSLHLSLAHTHTHTHKPTLSQNKEALKSTDIINKIARLIPCSSPDLVNSSLRFLFNLSFDSVSNQLWYSDWLIDWLLMFLFIIKQSYDAIFYITSKVLAIIWLSVL